MHVHLVSGPSNGYALISLNHNTYLPSTGSTLLTGALAIEGNSVYIDRVLLATITSDAEIVFNTAVVDYTHTFVTGLRNQIRFLWHLHNVMKRTKR